MNAFTILSSRPKAHSIIAAAVATEGIIDSPVIRRGGATCPSNTGKKCVRFQRGEASVVSNEVPPEANANDDVQTEVLCLLKPSSEMTFEEISDVWWQHSDFAHFQGTAQLISAEIRRLTASRGGESPPSEGRAPNYAQVVAYALDVCRRVTDGGTSSAATSSCDARNHPLSEIVLAYLAHWSSVGHSRRGLEKWSVAYRLERCEANREGIVRAVLEAQQQQQAGGASSSSPEAIGEASRRCSQSARMFALAMGMADAAAGGE